MISLDQAHQKVNRLQPLSPVRVSLDKAFGLFCAEAVHAAANCPTVDASLKDGFAVRSGDIASASEENPVQLHCVGTVTAGDQKTGKVQPGQAIRIMTGAAIPTGADAVHLPNSPARKGLLSMPFAMPMPGEIFLPEGSMYNPVSCFLIRELVWGLLIWVCWLPPVLLS